MKTRMVITDLDGTLLNPDREVSPDDLAALNQLEQKGICRVIATGRSVYSFSKVIPDDFPIDFLIFSSGAGVMDWHTKEIINSNSLSEEETSTIVKYLKSNNHDFMVHKPIPDNHQFLYYLSGQDNPDFSRRMDVYKSYSNPLGAEETFERSCQFVVIAKDSENHYQQLVKDLPDFKVIRTTSPLDHRSVWIEVFPKNVSKGHTADWLADRLGISHKDALSIGNDYNDIDLLDWAGNSYVVDNAPEELKHKYKVTKPNHLSAFSTVINSLI